MFIQLDPGETYRHALATLFGGFAVLLCAAANPSAAAEDRVSFAGKTITMIVGFEAGSGPDIYGRILGQNLVRYLPGQPNLIVINQLGAGGVVALNSWANKAEANGLFIALGTLSQTDPDALVRTNAKYDPTTFKYIGGLAAPSQGLFVNKSAVARLYDRSASPAVMGIVGTTLRSGNYQALWGAAFLGWNLKWVRGYTRTAELRQAMERGELDMTSFGSTPDIDFLQSAGKFSVVSQSGTVQLGKPTRRPSLGNAPMISELVRGKIKDPLAQQSFTYGENVSQIGMWLALPPRTPDGTIAAYVDAFEATLKDAKYREEFAKIDPDSPVAHKDDLAKLVGALSEVSPETLNFIQAELKRQGVD